MRLLSFWVLLLPLLAVVHAEEADQLVTTVQGILPKECSKSLAVNAAKLIREKQSAGEEMSVVMKQFRSVISQGCAGRWIQGLEADGVKFESLNAYSKRKENETGVYPKGADGYLAEIAISQLGEYKDWKALIEYARQIAQIAPVDKSMRKFLETGKLEAKKK
jgi:hypothetical protein